MANKFQKSVQERLEEEAKRQSAKKKEASAMEPSLETIEYQIPDEKHFTKTQPDFSDIGLYLRPETQRIAKNKTFYLDADVIETIKTTARVQRVTDSKLVNDILRKVLGL